MAKKVVATLKKDSRAKQQYTKCIKMTKTGKTGAYQFKEEMINNDLVNDFFKQ